MKNFDQVLIGAYSIAWYEVSERMRTPQLMYVLNRDSLNITFSHSEGKFVWIFSSEENSWHCNNKLRFSSQNFPAACDALEVKPSTGKSKPISRVIILRRERNEQPLD